MKIDHVLGEFLATLFAVSIAGCAGGGSAHSPQAATTQADSSADAGANADASSDAQAVGLPIPDGATVSNPVFSDDLCDQDVDCVPQATCHPNVCVLVEHQGALPVGMLCTDACFPLTLDCNYNRCACVAWGDAGARKCAMVSSAKLP